MTRALTRYCALYASCPWSWAESRPRAGPPGLSAQFCVVRFNNDRYYCHHDCYTSALRCCHHAIFQEECGVSALDTSAPHDTSIDIKEFCTPHCTSAHDRHCHCSQYCHRHQVHASACCCQLSANQQCSAHLSEQEHGPLVYMVPVVTLLLILDMLVGSDQALPAHQQARLLTATLAVR